MERSLKKRWWHLEIVGCGTLELMERWRHLRGSFKEKDYDF